MRVKARLNRLKRYEQTKAIVRKELIKIVTVGLNNVRNTAISGIKQGIKTGTVRKDGSIRSAEGEFPATDTGFLASNIFVKRSPTGLSGEVISKANYSAFLEFGTSKMGARPFMQPSLEENRPKIRARARRVFK